MNLGTVVINNNNANNIVPINETGTMVEHQYDDDGYEEAVNRFVFYIFLLFIRVSLVLKAYTSNIVIIYLIPLN